MLSSISLVSFLSFVVFLKSLTENSKNNKFSDGYLLVRELLGVVLNAVTCKVVLSGNAQFLFFS